MFTVNPNILLHSNPTCNREVAAVRLFSKSIDYFDKDGFELTELEREYYFVNGYKLDNTLNHHCYQQPWFSLDKDTDNFYLDHCTILHRCDYTEDAYRQLLLFQPKLPKLTYLIQCKQKWGVDFCLVNWFFISYQTKRLYINIR